MDKQPANKTEDKPVVIEQTGTPQPAAALAAGPGKGIWIATLLLAVAGVIGSVYHWQSGLQQQQQLQTIQGDTAGALQRIDAQATQRRELQRQLDRQNDAALQQQRQLMQRIEALQRQVSSQQKRLLSLSTTDRADWLLAEAEYLMRLANQRLLMGKEVKGAMELLKAADDILVELDDSGLFSVRQILANDMAALRAASGTDLEGLYLQLGAAANQADQLRLLEMPQLQLAEPEALQPEALASISWLQRLQSGVQAAWQRLGSYIQIKPRDAIYKPLLAPEYEAAVRQNLRLMFEQAQMATLAGNQRLYEDSLAKANDWLVNYYTLDKESAAVVIAIVDELRQQQVEIPLPDISASPRALKQYLDTIHSIKPLTKTGSATDQNTGDQAPADSGSAEQGTLNRNALNQDVNQNSSGQSSLNQNSLDQNKTAEESAQ